MQHFCYVGIYNIANDGISILVNWPVRGIKNGTISELVIVVFGVIPVVVVFITTEFNVRLVKEEQP